MYDPVTDTWAEMAPMPTQRRWLSCAAIGEKIYAVGGFRTEGTPALATIEAYDVATNTWESVAPLPTARKGLAAAVHDGKLYAIGGANVNEVAVSTVEMYDPATNSWSARASMPQSRAMLTAAGAGGEIYADPRSRLSTTSEARARTRFDSTQGTSRPVPTRTG